MTEQTWQLYGIPSYWYLKLEGNRKECERVNVAAPEMRPFACKTAQEFLEIGKRDGKKMPVGWFQTSDASVVAKDRFFCTSFRYSRIPIADLESTFGRLRAEHRLWCAIVVSGCRIHLFFDLDGKSNLSGKPFDHQVVKPTFKRVLARKFKLDFGREIDTSDEQWYLSHKQGEYSAHYHILSESFKDREHLNRWVKYNFAPWIVRQAMDELDMDCISLCQDADQKNWHESKVKSIVDVGMYSNNHQLRLGLNTKPGRPPFVPEANGDRELSVLEAIFRSSFCYALSGDESRILTWSEDDIDLSSVAHAATTKATRTPGQARLPPRSAADGAVNTSFMGDPDGDYSWLAQVHIPWYDDFKLPQPVVAESKRLQNGQPLVTFLPKSTVCIACTQKNRGEPKRHKSNHTYMYINASCTSLFIASHDDDCRRQRYEVPLTREIESKLLAARQKGVLGVFFDSASSDDADKEDVVMAAVDKPSVTLTSDVVTPTTTTPPPPANVKKRKAELLSVSVLPPAQQAQPRLSALDFNRGWLAKVAASRAEEVVVEPVRKRPRL